MASIWRECANQSLKVRRGQPGPGCSAIPQSRVGMLAMIPDFSFLLVWLWRILARGSSAPTRGVRPQLVNLAHSYSAGLVEGQ